MNTLDFLYLRKIIRKLIIESVEEEVDLPYEETLMPDETGKGVVGGPDLAKQPKRDDYLEKKAEKKVKKKKAKLHSRGETEESTGDENTLAGGGIVGHMDMSGYDGRDRPHGGQPLKSKNAMGDEYDE